MFFLKGHGIQLAFWPRSGSYSSFVIRVIYVSRKKRKSGINEFALRHSDLSKEIGER